MSLEDIDNLPESISSGRSGHNDDHQIIHKGLKDIKNNVEATNSKIVYGSRWVFDGDSITINGIATAGTVQDRGSSWTTELARLSYGRIKFIYNAAISGQRTDQALGRFDEFVAPNNPDVVFLTAGTNDIGASRDMSAWLADIEAYRLKCVGIGARLIIGSIWPTDNTNPVGRSATSRTWNNALYTWAVANKVQYVPWERLSNPTTGGWPTGWSSDGLHPTLLDGYTSIAKFAWDFLEPRTGSPVVRRAISNGADAIPNGFFTAGSNVPTPTLSAGTPTTGTGTLPAGAYSYKFTSRTYWGESIPSAAQSVTLSDVGQITIPYATATGARGFRVYRKGPSDSDWKYLTYISSALSGSFIDNGSFTAGANISGVATGFIPTGLTVGSATLKNLGQAFFSEPGVRGNIYRMYPYETGTGAPNDHFAIAVTPGEVYEISGLIRTNGNAEGAIVARFRDATTNFGQSVVAKGRLINGFGLAHTVITIPANTITLRLSFELTASADGGYLDVAEISVTKLS
jgi:lysophospholipase L1-like esterase